MQLTQLEYLIAVEKYGSISRAARELYTSQSSISTSIKTLETELGVELRGSISRPKVSIFWKMPKSSADIWMILRMSGEESPERFGGM